MKNAKQKGKALENWIQDQIIKRGLDDRAKRDGASGASRKEKRDIDTNITVLGRTVGIEAKNQKTIKILDWWRQTCKLEQLDYEPILIFKPHQEPLEGSLAVIRVETLLDLIKNQAEGVEENTGVAQSDKWQIERSREELRKTIKLLEKYI